MIHKATRLVGYAAKCCPSISFSVENIILGRKYRQILAQSTAMFVEVYSQFKQDWEVRLYKEPSQIQYEIWNCMNGVYLEGWLV